jgi:uncharacterized damage-inducible protein DinB
MSVEALRAELDHEMALTRRVLERVPEHAFDWKPHEKSSSLGSLATHLARLPHWGADIVERSEYDFATAPAPAAPPATRAELLAAFDAHVADARRAIEARSEAELDAPWVLKRGGHTVLSMPRITAVRQLLIHHMIHHRGQMTVYLRLQGVPLPPIYGPTADERP